MGTENGARRGEKRKKIIKLVACDLGFEQRDLDAANGIDKGLHRARSKIKSLINLRVNEGETTK